MNTRRLIDRLLSPAGFAVALLLFLLPFLTVSCEAPGGENAARVDGSFTGFDLLVGGSPDLSAVDQKGTSVQAGADIVAEVDAVFGQYYPPQPLVIVAALLLLAGLAAALALPAATRAWPSAVAAAGAVVLLAVEVLSVAPDRFADAMAAEIPGGGFGLATYQSFPGVGFFLCAVILVALAGWQVRQAIRPPAPIDEPAASQDPARFDHAAPADHSARSDRLSLFDDDPPA